MQSDNRQNANSQGNRWPLSFFLLQFCYSFDCEEPMHVHVQREKMICKFWLDPISLSQNYGFSPKEINQIRKIVKINLKKLIEAWHEHCG